MTSSADPVWLDPDQQSSWRAYIMGTTLLLDRLDHELREAHGISLSEYEVLVRLSEQPDGRARMASLANAMCHSRSRMTHTVGRMEHNGFVRRQASGEDGRGVEAELTPTGRRLLDEAAPLHVAGVRNHLVDLADADDLAAIGRVFNAVCDQLMDEAERTIDIRPDRV